MQMSFDFLSILPDSAYRSALTSLHVCLSISLTLGELRMMCFQFQFSYVHCESVEIQLVLLCSSCIQWPCRIRFLVLEDFLNSCRYLGFSIQTIKAPCKEIFFLFQFIFLLFPFLPYCAF